MRWAAWVLFGAGLLAWLWYGFHTGAIYEAP